MTHTIPIYQVDAFTLSTPQAFTGNPAAVCLLDQAKDEDWMQAVATEMNLSETAFVQKKDKGFDLRWFTPKKEVSLCGHATLATAHILWQQSWLAEHESAHFHTRSGLLIAKKHQDKMILDFPAIQTKPTDAPSGLLQALELSTGKIFSSSEDYLVQLEDETTLRNLKPDFVALSEIKTRGIIVTTQSSDDKYDFSSRFFAPAYGIDEDPVTGSAHCALAPFWAERLKKTSMKAFQASPRGGEIEIKLQKERILLSGKAITVLGGQLYV